MSRTVNLLLLIVGLVMTAVGLFAFRGNSVLFSVLVFGIGVTVVAIVNDHRRGQRAKEKRGIEVHRRIAELTQTPWHSKQTLKIHGSLSTTIIILVIGLASAFAAYIGLKAAPIQLPLVLGSSIVLALTLAALSRSVAGLKKPVCELDRDGFATSIHGRISWREVAGIHLAQYTSRGVTTNTLLIWVKRYILVVTNIHWTERVLALFGLGASRRGIIWVRLKDSKEKPETIYAVARYLWKEATGLEYEWHPTMSDAFNEAARRMEEINASLLDPVAVDLRLEQPQEMIEEFEQVKKDMATMRTELARQSSGYNWAVGIVVIVLLIAIAWALVEPVLNNN